MKDLHWPDERYVRIYTRDTPEWLALSFEAQALYALIHRKAGRAGRIVLGRQGAKGVAVILHRVEKWKSVLEPALTELITDGFVTISDGILAIPDFVAAQEAVSSGKARQRKHLERRKGADEATHDAVSLEGDEASPGDGTSAESDAGVQHGPAQHGTEGEARYEWYGVTTIENTDGHGDSRAPPGVRDDSTGYRHAFSDDEDWSFQMREPLSALDAGLFDKMVDDEVARIKALPERARPTAAMEARARIEARFRQRAKGAVR